MCAGPPRPAWVNAYALARTFELIDAELKAVHTEEWERTFALFRLLI